MFDQTFWVALAFVMFIAVVYKPVSRKMAAALDARAEKIKQELDEAVRLREEAHALLAGYERRQNEVLKEAEDILGHAREEAERQTRQAGEALEVFIRRREAQAVDRIARAEEEATADVRNAAVELAMATTRKLIISELKEDRAQALIDDAIAELGDKLH
jgi:F-type H+-transporting ATPase subunit b